MHQGRYPIAKDGSYRLVGLPGPAIVGVDANRDSFYPGQGASEIQGDTDPRGHFLTLHTPRRPGKDWPTAMKKINPAEGTESVELDFALDPGQQVEISMVDPSGRPISGVSAERMEAGGHQPTRGSTFLVTALGPHEEPRTILLHHEQRGLGKVVRVRADDRQPKLTAQLQACAKISGRLVDADQRPVVGAEIKFWLLPQGDFSRLESTATDADGHFRHLAVLPGASYRLFTDGKREGSHEIAKEISVEPGETINLGTIDVTGDKRPEPVRTKAAQTVDAGAGAAVGGPAAAEKPPVEKPAAEKPGAPQEPRSLTISGKVKLPDAAPAAGAHVAVIGLRITPDRGGAFSPRGAVLAEGTTDAEGNYQFQLAGVSSKTHLEAHLIARQEGYALAWRELNLDAKSSNLSLSLVPSSRSGAD